jgi:hypothetical protein
MASLDCSQDSLLLVLPLYLVGAYIYITSINLLRISYYDIPIEELSLSEILVCPVVELYSTCSYMCSFRDKICVIFVFRFHDSIEHSIKLRSTHQELLGALCLVQNFRKLTEIQYSEVFSFSGELSREGVQVLY